MNEQTALSMVSAAAWLIAHSGDGESTWSVDVKSYDGTVVISQWLYDSGDYDYESESYSISAVDNMVALRKSLGGVWDKVTNDYEFALTQEVAPNVTVKLSVSRKAACELKVVGTETVEVKDYDACPTKTITRDIIEYDCKPILGEQQEIGYGKYD